MGKLTKLAAIIAGGGIEIKEVIVAGAAANADLAISGLKADAVLLGVAEHATAALPVDRLSVATVKAGGGAVHVNDDTTGNAVRVLYAQRA